MRVWPDPPPCEGLACETAYTWA